MPGVHLLSPSEVLPRNSTQRQARATENRGWGPEHPSPFRYLRVWVLVPLLKETTHKVIYVHPNNKQGGSQKMGIFLNYIIPLLLLVGFLLLQLTLPAHFSERVKEKEKTWNTVLNLLYGGKKGPTS